MSYEIIYNKQFVRLRKTGEVIPIILCGSNNCFDIGRDGRCGRRSRDWSNFRHYNRKGKLSEKPDIILINLDAELRRYIRRHRGDDGAKPADIRNHFGYYASLAVGGGRCFNTSWDLWRSQFANGIKDAMTIEELANLGLYLRLYSYSENTDGRPAEVAIKTEREYFAELRKWREWEARTGKRPSVDFHLMSTDAVLNRLHAHRRKTPREKTRLDQNHYFILTDGYNALVKYTRRGYRFRFDKGNGKRFRTEKEAENYRQRLLKNERYQADIWKVERIESNATFMV